MGRPDSNRSRGGSMTPRGGRGGFRGGGGPNSAPGKFGGGGGFRGRGGDRGSPFRGGGRGGFSPRGGGGERGRGGFSPRGGRGGFDRGRGGRGGFDRGRGRGRGGFRGGHSGPPRKNFGEEEDNEEEDNQPKRLKKPVAKEEESDDEQMGSEGEEESEGEEGESNEEDEDEEDSEEEPKQKKGLPAVVEAKKSVAQNGSAKKSDLGKGKSATKDVSVVAQVGSDDDDDEEEDDDEDSEEEEEESDEDAEEAVESPPRKSDAKAKVTFTPDNRSNETPSQKKTASTSKVTTPHPKQTKADLLGKRKVVADEEDEEESDEEESDEDEDEEDEETTEVKPIVKGKATPSSSKATSSAEQPTKKESAASGKRKLDADSEAPVGKIRKVTPAALDDKLLSEEKERLKERDRRTLFFKNLPKQCTDDDIKALSSDILTVRRKGKDSRFGWLIFADEETCDRNYPKLKKAQMKGQFKLTLDFCGEKSENLKNKPMPSPDKSETINALELYIGNIPKTVTMEDLKKKFPSAIDVHFPKTKGARIPETKYAFVSFTSVQDARTAFEKSRKLELGGVPLEVMFAKVKSKPQAADKKTAESSAAVAKAAPTAKQPAATQKVVVAAKSALKKVAVVEEEESDDDDEEEEEEGSEEESEEDDDE